MLPMKELAAMFAAAGCSEVETYIQSGNVVFSAGAGVVKGLDARSTKGIAEGFGYKVPVVLRSGAQMGAVARANPFLKADDAVDLLHVYFLAEEPEREAVRGLDAGRSPGDRFEVVGGDIYLELGNGMGKTKLTNAYFDSKLKTVSTARNWRTVLKLLEMLEG